MTYVLAFEKDADPVNLELQKNALQQEYPDMYWKGVDGYPSYEDMDRYAKEAVDYCFDNMVILSPEDEYVDLDNVLQSEIGYLFKEVKAIPEQFFRMKEADAVSQPQPQAQTQTQAVKEKPQPAVQMPSTIDLIACDVNYPTRKGWQAFRNQIQSSYCVLSLAKLRGQYLNAQTMVQLLQQFPDAAIAKDASSIFSQRGLYATFDPQQEISLQNVIEELQEKRPNIRIQNVCFHVANVQTPIRQIALKNGQTVNVTYKASQPGWDSSTNASIWKNLVELSNDKKNGYKNLYKKITKDKVDSQDAKGDKSADKATYDPDNVKRLQEETQNGWLMFIQKLIETVPMHEKEGYSTKVMNSKEAKSYMSNLEKYWKSLAKPDIEAVDEMMSDAGLDLLYKPLANLAKDAAKDLKDIEKNEKAKDVKLSKDSEPAYYLVGTEQYRNIKEAIGLK